MQKPLQQEQLPQLSPEFLFDNSETTKSLDELAKIVAFSLTDKRFREFIKTEALKQIDGDYDVIYELTKNKSVNGKLTLADFLKEKATELYGKKIDIEKLIAEIPYFQISVPVNCENWDTENYIPLVTYIPKSFDEATFKFVKAYDYQGNVYTLSLDEEPNVPVVVLGSCERIDWIEGAKPVIPEGEDIIQPGDTINNRDDNNNVTYNYIILKRLTFTDLKAVEKWVQGKPEIFGYIYNQDGGDPIGSFADTPKRKHVNKKWKIYDHQFTRINRRYDEYYIVKFVEKDDDLSLNLKFELKISKVFEAIAGALGVNIPSKFLDQVITVGINIKLEDSENDDLGSYRVFLDDPNPGKYGNYIFYFELYRN